MLQHFDVIVLYVRAQCADLHGWFSFILLTKHHSRLIYFFVCNYNSLVRSFGSQLSFEFFTGLLLVLLYVFLPTLVWSFNHIHEEECYLLCIQKQFFWGKSFVPYQYSKIVFTLFPISFVILAPFWAKICDVFIVPFVTTGSSCTVAVRNVLFTF